MFKSKSNCTCNFQYCAIENPIQDLRCSTAAVAADVAPVDVAAAVVAAAFGDGFLKRRPLFDQHSFSYKDVKISKSALGHLFIHEKTQIFK